MREYARGWLEELKKSAMDNLYKAHTTRANCYDQLNHAENEVKAATLYQNLMFKHHDDAVKELIEADDRIKFFERQLEQIGNKLNK